MTPGTWAPASACALTLLLFAWPVPLLMFLDREPDGRTPTHRVLALLTGWWALQLALGLTVGLPGQLTGPLLPALQAVVLLAGSACWLMPRRRSARGNWSLPRQPQGAEGTFLFILLMLAVLLGFLTLRSPSRNFDALSYHLPVMAHWVQQGGLGGFAELGHVGMYPAHIELMSTLLFLPWGHDLLTGLAGWLAWLHGGLALYVLWRSWGVTSTAALAAVALFLTAPDILARIDGVQPDLAVVGFWAAGAVGATHWIRSGRRADLILAVLAAGVLLGLKLSGPIHLLLLLLPASLARWLSRGRARSAGSVGRTWLVAAVALAAFIGTGWYLRNWAQSGNPAGLVEVKIAGQTLFEGSLSRAELVRGSLARVFQWREGADWWILWGVFWRGYGPQGAALVLLAAGGLVAGLHKGRPARWLVLLLALVVAESALYWNAPYSADNGSHGYTLSPWMDTGLRYGYLVAGLLSGAAAVGLQALGRRGPYLGLPLVTVGGLWSAARWALSDPVLLWISIVLALAVSAWIIRGHPRPGGIQLLGLLSTGILAGCVLGACWHPGREADRAKLYGPVYRELRDQGGSAGVVVVNSQELIRYAGSDWQRPVTVVKPAAGQTLGAWLRHLQAEGFGWLVLGTASGAGFDPAAAEILTGLEKPDAPATRILAGKDLQHDEQLYQLRK